MTSPKYIVICGMPRSGTFTLATFFQLHPFTQVYSNSWYKGWEPEHWRKGEKVGVKWNAHRDDPSLFSEIERRLSEMPKNGPILVNRSDGYEYNWRNLLYNVRDIESWRFIYAERKKPDASFDSMVKAGNYPERGYHVYCLEKDFSQACFHQLTGPKMRFSVDEPDYDKLMDFVGLEMSENQKWYAEINPVTHRGPS